MAWRRGGCATCPAGRSSGSPLRGRLAQGAEIILADEATANLDVLTKDDIMDLLCAIARDKGATLVLSMHDLPLARRFCTRIVGLKHGRITFDAAPAALSDAAVADVLERLPREDA